MKKIILFFCIFFAAVLSARAQNVGIGTTRPMAILDIKRPYDTYPTLMLSDSILNYAGQLRLRSLMPTYLNKFWDMNFKVGTDPKEYEFGILTDNTNVMKLYGTGNITIGNISPQARLSVKAYPGLDILNITGSGDEPALKINASRNIGIKNPAPTETLDIAGNMRADTVKTSVVKIAPNAGAGKILTSDAAGNATWQTSTSTAAASSDNLGYGVWGDCATNGNIGDYNPVAMEDGERSDAFGYSVSVDGDYAVIGAPSDDGAFVDQGSASIYRLVAGVWTFQTKLLSTSPVAEARFGYSVSINGDYIIIGAPNEDGAIHEQGSASIYHLDQGVWTFQAKLLNTNPGALDHFGYSVAIYGHNAIVGAYQDDATGFDKGSATIYNMTGTIWTFQVKLLNTNSDGHYFGHSVAINGNYAVVGTTYDNNATIDNPTRGSVSIYRMTTGAWKFHTKLFNIDAVADDDFGSSVAINGNYVITGTDLDVVAGIKKSSASIYRLVADAWVFQTKLSDATLPMNSFFGFSASINGGYAIVGAFNTTGTEGVEQGVAVTYKKLGNSWEKYQYIIDPHAVSNARFGWATSIDGTGKHFLIGAHAYNNAMGKAKFGKLK